jgi:hypothetical protein
MDFPDQTNTANRIEKGFVGSHADIGGGYGTGDLSDVALMWMLAQAKDQGIGLKTKVIEENGWDTVSNPVVHDKSINRLFQGDVLITRDVFYQADKAKPGLKEVPQTAASFGGKMTKDTRDLITYFSRLCGDKNNPEVGMVNMQLYTQWLSEYGVGVKVAAEPVRTCK